MTARQIRALGPALSRFLDQFADCFVHPDTQEHLKQYVQGQLSDLPRKSVEPIANFADIPPRTLQEFLSLSEWDEDRLRDTVQFIVARDRPDPQAILIIDESGHPKKGNQTACVHRDYCGATGKVDNCVMTVHLCYASFDGKFRAMLDSDLFLPQTGWNDVQRREKVQIPESVVYRPKYEIARAQLQRALANGVPTGWVTADEWYGQKPAFIEELERMNLRFVLEIPKNVMGWLYDPKHPGVQRGEVQNLVRWSHPMLYQEWVDYHIKDTGMGAMVWEAKSAPFWMKREDRVVGPYWLVAARDRLNQDTIKYFLSNAPAGVPLEVLLHVGFSRWPVERTLEDEKTELGLSHFEVRKYPAVLRHLRITQVSHLFLACQTQRLAEKKSRGDDLPGTRRGQRDAGRIALVASGPGGAPGQNRTQDPPHPARECRFAGITRQGASARAESVGNPHRQAPVLHAAAQRVAL